MVSFQQTKMVSRPILIGFSVALGIVFFVGGLLIGRFAIPRPAVVHNIFTTSLDQQSISTDRSIVLTETKRNLLNRISAKEIGKNLEYLFQSKNIQTIFTIDD